tara:strand:- start:194 stop:1090 length:897 start_codon:yes stop_codon:yes gene_type:complete
MKWIGQNIWSFISRFRSDVYLEASVNPAADVDKFLVQGADGKVGFRTGAEVLSDIGASTASGDITSVVAGDSISGGGTSGDVTLNVDTASTSARGAVELATTAETTTGTDTGRAVTPDGLKDGYRGSTNVTILGTVGTGVWNGTAIATAYIADDAVTFAKAIGVTPNVFESTIKILPSDFMANDDPGVTKTLQFVDEDASGIKPGDNDTELLAFVSIPEGKSATHAEVFADANLAFKVYELNINASVADISAAEKGSGTCNTQLDITNVESTETNYLLIQVVTVSKADRVWGARITIG